MTFRRLAGAGAAGVVLGLATFIGFGLEPAEVEAADIITTTTGTAPATTPTITVVTTTIPTTTTTTSRVGGVGEPYGEVVGLTMFRGNPTRSWYGSGPLPDSAPAEQWK